MKKIVITSLALVILSILVVFLLFFFYKATTLKEEGIGEEIDILNINEIEVIRGSDDKTVILKEGQTHQLMKELMNAKLIEGHIEEESTESYWIHIKDGGERLLGIRMDNSLTFSAYDYKEHKTYSNNYTLEDDSVLKSVERLFEWHKSISLFY